MDRKLMIYLTSEQHEQLRLEAFMRRRSMADLVREALDLWFAQHGQAPGKPSQAKDSGQEQ